MSTLQAIIIAIIEGLTEYLPISSTAHMGFTAALMGMPDDEYLKMFPVWCYPLDSSSVLAQVLRLF